MDATRLRDALRATQALGLDRLDAQLLLLQALARSPQDRAWLLAHDGDELPPATAQRFHLLVQRRLAGEPVAYIAGHKEFFGLDLKVDPRVLVPRPDTETLVQWALDLLHGMTARDRAPRILDLGTGSGAIALAVAHSLDREKRAADIVAVDASADALDVARANAQSLQLRVDFAQSDWFAGVGGCFDLIVSNPPYIAAEDPHLAALVHEPLDALASGDNGLDDIRRIVAQAPAHLHAGGWLLLEHGYDQADAVSALLRQRGFRDIGHRLDLAGVQRCTGGCWPG